MRYVTMALALGLVSGCHDSKPHIKCSDDAQCTLAGRPGACIESACAIPDAACPSGYRYDTTAGGSGDCVVVPSGTDLSMPDMAMADDMATEDMTTLPPDMSMQSTDMAGVPSSWVKLTNSTMTSIASVWATTGKVYLAGQSTNTPRVVLSTNNGGVWSTAYFTPAPSTSFTAVYGVGTEVWTGGGASGEVYHATDGMNFTKQTSAFTQGALNSFSGTGADLWAAGSAGLMHSTNAGATWLSANSSTFGYDALHGVARSSGYVYTIGYFTTAHVYTSPDGTTFTSTTAPKNPLGIWSTPDGAHVYVVGDAMILHSKAGGAFMSETAPSTAGLNAVWSTATGEAFAVGANGLVLHTDGSGTWTQMAVPSTDTLQAVSGSSASDVWVGGASGTLLHYH